MVGLLISTNDPLCPNGHLLPPAAVTISFEHQQFWLVEAGEVVFDVLEGQDYLGLGSGLS